MKKSLVRKFGLLGYPGYDWLSQAVSDLSAANAPSLALWNQLTAFYNVCEVVCVTVVCIGIQGQKTNFYAWEFIFLRLWNGYPRLATERFRSPAAATRARFRTLCTW